MKTAIIALLSTIVAVVTASASPTLRVETTFTEHHANGGQEVLKKAPAIWVVSGKQATLILAERGTLKKSELEYAVTPTLLDDGTVDINAILTERDGEKADKLAAPRIKAKLGEAVEIQIGQYTVATKTSLAK